MMKLLLGTFLLLAVEVSHGSPVSGTEVSFRHLLSFTMNKLFSGLLTLQYEADISTINPCKDKDLLSCTPTFIDWNKLEQSSILLPGGQVLEQKKKFTEGRTSFVLFSDELDNKTFFSYRNNRMMGRVRTNDQSMFFIEPCNNWEGCHVWKKISQDIFVDETHEVSFDEKKISESERERIAELTKKGKTDKEEVAEYTLMLYYTRDFAAHTDDIELYMDTIIPI